MRAEPSTAARARAWGAPNQIGLRARARRRGERVGKPTRDLSPVVLVPGVLGTSLVDPAHGSFPVWGSYKGTLLYRDRYEDLDRSILPDVHNRLVPGEVLWSFPVVPWLVSVPIYEELARTLEELGYARSTFDAPVRSGLYGLSYDWRQGVVAGARALEAAIDRVQDAIGPCRVHLVGHSFGSLVIRYYLRYGGADVLSRDEAPRPGGSRVDTVFSVGAPFAGSLRAFHELEHGFSPGGPIGRPVSPHHVASHAAAYQLLRYEPDFAVDARGEPLHLDMADVEAWERLRWGAFSPKTMDALHQRAKRHRPGLTRVECARLARELVRGHLTIARRLWDLLRAPNEADRGVRTVTYASANHPTLTRAIVDERRGERRFLLEDAARTWPALARSLSAPGDGYLAVDEVRGTSGADPAAPAAPASGKSYVLVAPTRGHRYLLQSGPILDDLARNVAHTPPRPSVVSAPAPPPAAHATNAGPLAEEQHP